VKHGSPAPDDRPYGFACLSLHPSEMTPKAEAQLPPVPPKAGTQSGRSGRFRTNLVASTAAFFFGALLNLWLTRYLIAHLGVEAYGLVPLITSIVAYIGIVTLALNTAVGRFLTISLERGELAEANMIFNTSLFGTFVLVLLLSAPAALVAYNVGHLLVLPVGHESSARWLLGGALFAFLATALASPFEISTYCRNRLELRSLVSVLSTGTRVLFIFVLFTTVGTNLGFVGWGFVVGGCVYLVAALLVWRFLTPQLRVQPRAFSADCLRRLLGTGGWVVVNQVGSLLLLSVDLMIVNRFLGAVEGGRYAVALQLAVFLRLLATALAAVFGPSMLYRYAEDDIDGLVKLACRAMKLLGLVMAIPIGLVIGFSRPLLGTWLGSDFVSIAPLLILLTVQLPINLCVQPLFYVQVATNRVKVPGIVTCLTGLGNVALAIWLVGSGLGVYGVALAGAIMLTAKNAVFTPLYAAGILRRSPISFYREIGIALAGSAAVGGVAWLVAWQWNVWGIWSLAVAGVGIGAAFGVVAYAAILTADERRLLWALVAGREL
jgi:O-antigen/teichoic acid export membrane protein